MLSQNVDKAVDSDQESNNLPQKRVVTRRTAKASSLSLFGPLPPAQRPRVKSCGSIRLSPELRTVSESTAASSLDSLEWDNNRKATELSDNTEPQLFTLGDDDLFSDSDCFATPDATPEVSPVKRASTSSHSSRLAARARLAEARERLDQDVPGHRQLKPALVKRLLDRQTRNDRRLSDRTIRASLNLPPRPRRISSNTMAGINEQIATHRSKPAGACDQC